MAELELGRARSTALKAALTELEHYDTAAAQRLTLEFQAALTQARQGRDPHDSSDNVLRRQVLPAARRAIDDLRRAGEIGDSAFRLVQAELDWLELSAGSSQKPANRFRRLTEDEFRHTKAEAADWS